MGHRERKLPALLKSIRGQLRISQEDLARELGVSFATVNRWENGQALPSKLAKAQLDAFCARLKRQGKLKLPNNGGARGTVHGS